MIFFDVAGTLMEVRGSVGEIYARVAGRHGFEVAPAELQRRFARHFPLQPPMAFPTDTPRAELPNLEKGWWCRLVREVFTDGRPFPRFDDFFAEVFDTFRREEAWRLYDDVEPTLAELKRRGLRLGIISNFDSRLEDLLRAFKLDRYFDAVHLSSREGAAKPDAGIFRAALAESQIEPTQALHVGDSLREDVEGAAAVGIRPVLLDRQHRWGQDLRYARITRLDQLLDPLIITPETGL